MNHTNCYGCLAKIPCTEGTLPFCPECYNGFISLPIEKRIERATEIIKSRNLGIALEELRTMCESLSSAANHFNALKGTWPSEN